MEVARTSMIHAAAPHFLWPFAVRYAAHQLNLWPSCVLAGDLAHTALDEEGWRCFAFYHPTSRRIFPSQDVTFDKSVPFYRLFPYRTAPLPPLVFLVPGPPPVDPLPPQGPAPSAERPGPEGAIPERAEPGGAEPRGAEPGGTAPERAEPGVAASGGAELGGTASAGGLPGASPQWSPQREPLSPQQLREWLARRTRLRSHSGAGGTGAGGAGAGGPAVGGTGARGTGAGGTGAGATRAEPGGTALERESPGGAEPEGAEPGGATSAGGLPGASPQKSPQRGPLSPQQLREWFARRSHLRSSAAGAGGAGAGGAGAGGAGAGGAGAGDAGAGAARAGGARAGDTGASDADAGNVGARGIGAGDAGAGDAGAGGAGAGGAGAGGAGAGGADAGDTRAGDTGVGGAGAGGPGARGAGAGGAGAGGLARQRPFFLPSPQLFELPPESVLRQVLSLPSSTALPPDSPLPAPSRYTEQPERRGPASRLDSPVRTARRVPRPRPPPVPGTHTMALRPSTAPQRVPLPSPPASSLPEIPDPQSNRVRAASPTVTRLLATVVTDPSFESTTASALVAELVDFAAACRLDYVASPVGESESVCPPSVGGECALGTDVLEDRQEDFECLAAAVPHLVAWLLAPEGDPDALDILTPRSFAEAITRPYSS
ncbi:unnamed protein product [Closterium sp. Yama58-4]|nr:unnamed protein product [Closterium sp. Yama58-4]